MKALTLTHEAAQLAAEIYRKHGSETHLLADAVLLKCLILAIDIAQRVIEGRSVLVNLLVVPQDIDLNRRIQTDTKWGAEFLQLQRLSTSDLTFQRMKVYLNTAEDLSTFLVIQFDDNGAQVQLGLLSLGASVEAIMSVGRLPWMLQDTDILWRIFQYSPHIGIRNGSVTFELGGQALFQIRHGELCEVPSYDAEIDAIFHVSRSLWKAISELTAALNRKEMEWMSLLPSEYEIFDDNYVAAGLRLVLRDLIGRIATAGHGGTLVFGTSWPLSDAAHYQPGAIAVHLPFGEILLQRIAIQYDRSTAYDQGSKSTIVIAERITAMKRALINLSKTDGAIVFDENLAAVGAGTFLKVVESVKTEGGARRKSAEAFVKANPSVAAIVISQDGGVYLYR